MLTDLKVRKAEPREKAYKMADGGGLYLYVLPSGYRSWRMKYRFGGKERRLVFGPYPEVSLKDARSNAMARTTYCANIAIPPLPPRRRS